MSISQPYPSGGDVETVEVRYRTDQRIAADPHGLPWALRVAAQAALRTALRRYERAYRARRPLDDRAVLYYKVFRAVTQLASVGQARATGRAGGGAFHSPAGAANLIALIRRLSGVSLRLDR